MRTSKYRAALGLALAYALIAGLWILLSNRWLGGLTADPRLLIHLDTLKDAAFVILTALLLYFLLRRGSQTLERRDTQAREIEQHLKVQTTALETAANAIYITDLEGRITWVNPAFTRLTGLTAEEALGQSPRLLKSGHHAPSFYQKLWETILSGQVWRGEIVDQRKDGSLYIVEQTITPVRDERGAISHFIAIKQDITERKRAEERLRGSEEKFRNLVETLNDWVWEINERGVYTYVSPRVREILGYAPEEILGKTPFDIMPAEEAKRVAEVFAPIADRIEPFVLLDNVNLHKDGHPVVLETSGMPMFDSQGVFRGYRGIDRDITERKRAEEALQARARQQAVVAELGQWALAGTDLARLLDEAVTRLARTLDVEYCKVLELLPDGKALLLRAGVGWKEGAVGSAVVGAGTDSQAGYTLLSTEPVIVEELRTEARFSGPPLLHDHGVVSGVSVIIPAQDRPFGVLGAHTTRRRTFTRDDIHFLQAVANVLATAIERRRTEEALRARSRQLEAVHSINMEITQELDLSGLLDLITRRAVELVGGTSGDLSLWDEAAQVLVPHAWLGHTEWFEGMRWKLGEGIVGTVAQRRQGMILNDYRNSPYAHPRILKHTAITACLGEPLLYQDRLLGVITADRLETGRPFTEEDRQLLSLFAVQAAIAIENARLHETTVRRAQQLGTLTELTRVLTTVLEPEAVAQEILRAVQVLIPGAAARLWEREGDEAVLHLVASRGLREPEGGLRLFPLGEGLIGLAAATRQPVTSPNVTADPRFLNRAWGASEGLVSCIILPLLYGEKLHGVLAIFTRTPYDFTDKKVNLLQSFAAQAAIAIENARLYREALEKTERLEGLTRTSAKVAGTLRLEGVLEAIAEEAAKLLRVEGAGFRLLEGDQLVVGGKYGLAHHVMLRPSLRVGESLTGLVAQQARALSVADLREDQSYLPEHKAGALAHGVVAYLGVPLRYRDRIIGVLNVYGKERRRFHEGEVSLLTAFADHAAVAIENARLYEERRLAAIQLEAAVEDRTRELQATNRQLEEASRHKSEFLANMSHELRTPLNSIIGFSALLREHGIGPLTDKQARYLGHIHRAGQHLLELINDILDLSKVEAGKLTLQAEPLPVATILEDILVVARGLANKKVQTVEARIPADLPLLPADPVRFKQICFNLLSNAVKFTPEGGHITVTARQVIGVRGQAPRASVQFPTPDPWPPIPGPQSFLEICVTDTGIGIKAEDLSRLFQEFVQLEAAESKRYEGTGLGLALTKRLVELHGGRIWAASEGEGRGSTFTVVLPFTQPSQ